MEVAGQVALRPKTVKLIKFFRREPSHNLSNFGHDGPFEQSA